MTQPSAPTDLSAAISVDGLTKRFGDLVAVDNLTFEVGASEIFGFLGPNGAGKTTTISMLCTLLPPSSGSASIRGRNVAEDSAAVRRQIGIIFQDTTVDDRLTARENLILHGDLYFMERRGLGERADTMLEQVGLADRADAQVVTFSGGMKRRLEIARGLMHRPAVLFLDEPTVGLDPQTRRSLWQSVESLREQEGVTIFMTTHYMDEAEVCDRIAIIDHGKLVALDTPANLKRGMGGDLVTCSAADNETLAHEIADRFDVTPEQKNGTVQFAIENAEEFVPTLVSSLSTPIRSVAVRQPTLDDVFVSLTGHAIRDEGAGDSDRARDLMRGGGRGPGMMRGGMRRRR